MDKRQDCFSRMDCLGVLDVLSESGCPCETFGLWPICVMKFTSFFKKEIKEKDLFSS
jgi:hypothetical protein